MRPSGLGSGSRGRAIAPRGSLYLLLIGFAALAASGLYLGAITLAEWLRQVSLQDYLYQLVFIAHLFLGLLVGIPLLAFALVHVRRAWRMRNSAARWLGAMVLLISLGLLVTGILISRFEVFAAISPSLRDSLYWLHLLAAALLVPLFVSHRLRGRRKIDWRAGKRVTLATTSLALLLIAVAWGSARFVEEPVLARPGSPEDFDLSLAKTANGRLLAPEKMMVDDYCKDCHADTHASWQASVHRFSSFNNPAYAFSVRELRQKLIDEKKPLSGVMFCAACHDPVPLFAGYLRDPSYDDVNHPTASAGVNCLACHAIRSVDSSRGNGDYTIAEPRHYPFAFSDSAFLAAVSRQLIRAKPALHKRTFLQAAHRDSEFCSTCHKVFLPQALNEYKWLRGQNHFDPFMLSGVSGHAVGAFYYPPKARANCHECHMKPTPAPADLAANASDDGSLVIPDHSFATANSGIWPLMNMADPALEKREAMLRGALRVDLFGIREEGALDGALHAPLRPQLPALQPGRSYLIETVLRTLTLGHVFTQGTADSNEIWVELEVRHQGKTIFSSGSRNEIGEVDPWSHFVNVYMLDRNGDRVDRRNVRDIFVPLYNHQIPPGAADVLHYRLRVPEHISGSLEIEAKLYYRKFDTTYLRHIQGANFVRNELPAMLIASDKLVLPLADAEPDTQANPLPTAPLWERWNDYGIGLLRKEGPGGRSQLRQAGEAFAELEAIGRAEGALNAARVYLREGRLDEAASALRRAREHESPAYPWSVAWFSGLVSKQQGQLEAALQNFQALKRTEFSDAQARGFDFSTDYGLLNEIGQTLYELAKIQRGDAASAQRTELLQQSTAQFEEVLKLDAENAVAHFNLAQIYELLGKAEQALEHRQFHEMVKVDENAIELAVSRHRAQNPAADRAAEQVMVYELRRMDLAPINFADPPETGAKLATAAAIGSASAGGAR